MTSSSSVRSYGEIRSLASGRKRVWWGTAEPQYRFRVCYVRFVHVGGPKPSALIASGMCAETPSWVRAVYATPNSTTVEMSPLPPLAFQEILTNSAEAVKSAVEGVGGVLMVGSTFVSPGDSGSSSSIQNRINSSKDGYSSAAEPPPAEQLWFRGLEPKRRYTICLCTESNSGSLSGVTVTEVEAHGEAPLVSDFIHFATFVTDSMYTRRRWLYQGQEGVVDERQLLQRFDSHGKIIRSNDRACSRSKKPDVRLRNSSSTRLAKPSYPSQPFGAKPENWSTDGSTFVHPSNDRQHPPEH